MEVMGPSSTSWSLSMAEISYQLASWPEEDDLVAEILIDDEIFASILCRGKGRFELRIHAHSDEWIMSADELAATLTEICQRLGA